MGDPREILRVADALRSRARRAEEAAKCLSPGVGLTLTIGSIRIDDPETKRVVQSALEAFAADLIAEAETLESRITVAKDGAP